MNKLTALLALCFILLVSLASSRSFEAGAADDADKLVYADFENVKENQPFSNNGGVVRLYTYQESPSSPSIYKGLQGTNVPEVVRLKQDDPNRAVTFEYQFQPPNQWAGVGMEVYGHEEKDGKIVADDVSGYKYMSLQLYVTGVTSISAEFVSRGQGIKMDGGFPALIFKVKPGFNTYRVPLDTIRQPPWAEIKVNTKDILKKLTSVNLVASCNQCTPLKGVVVVDNMVFQK